MTVVGFVRLFVCFLMAMISLALGSCLGFVAGTVSLLCTALECSQRAVGCHRHASATSVDISGPAGHYGGSSMLQLGTV